MWARITRPGREPDGGTELKGRRCPARFATLSNEDFS
jgi:hypothetical protein